jgi:type IV secretion system protein VirD4
VKVGLRQGPKGLYDLPKGGHDPYRMLIYQGGGYLFLFIVLGMWVATEIAAARLGFQASLGAQLFPRVYQPAAGLHWLYEFRHVHDPRVHMIFGQFWHDLGICLLLACAGVAAIVWRTLKESKKNDLHGSAHWATPDEVKKSGLLAGKGVYVGAWIDSMGKTRYLRHDGPEHILAFAPTRSGKGVGLVLPTLLSWPHSVLIHDIKGENYALTAGWRSKELGNRVLKFDPANNDGSSCRYNPLDNIRLRTEYEVKDIQNIVQILTDPEGKASQTEEAHWIATSSALLLGVILHVMYVEPDKTLGGVASFLSDPSFESSTQLFEYMLHAQHDPDGSMHWVNPGGGPTTTHPVVAMAARDMLNRDPKESSSVMSTAVRFFTLFRDPVVSHNVGFSDFGVKDLMNGDAPLSLYLVIPPSDIDRIKPLTRLLINQLLRALTNEMKFEDGRSVANYKHRLLLMIDEFPSLGRLEIMQTSLAYMAGYGIKAYLIAQDVSQLAAAYGGQSGHDETIMANCSIQVAFAPNKIETMELISKLVGQATVQNESRTYMGPRVGFRSQVQVNSQPTQRSLLTADEARRLPDDDALIFVAGCSPIYGRKIKYYEDRVFSQRSRISPPDTIGGKVMA